MWGWIILWQVEAVREELIELDGLISELDGTVQPLFKRRKSTGGAKATAKPKAKGKAKAKGSNKGSC